MSSNLTQTELGVQLGVSSISMGKKLIELKLRDAQNKLATKYAIDNNLGKIVTYNKANEVIQMNIWNERTITYILNKTKKDVKFCAESLFGKLKELKKIEDNDTGQKLDSWMFNYAQESFLDLWKKYSENMEILSIFLNKLEKEDLIQFAEKFEDLKNLKILIMHDNLTNKLKTKDIKDKVKKI